MPHAFNKNEHPFFYQCEHFNQARVISCGAPFT